MKRILKNIGLGFVLFASAYSCNLDYFKPDKFAGGGYRPTFAVPIANFDMTIADILKRYKNNIVLTDEGNRSFLTLIFSDTLAPIELDQFAQAGVIDTGTTSIPIANQKVDLKLFGNFDNGSFQLTNPRIDFSILNSTKSSFLLSFKDGEYGEFYTEKKNGDSIRYLEVRETTRPYPYPIPASKNYYFSFDNTNVVYTNDNSAGAIGAMTQVLEPTPKFLNYSVELKPTNTNTLNASGGNGSVQVIAGVFLPLEGYGDVTYIDTANYNFVDTGQVKGLNFLELRLIVTNGIPLEGTINKAMIVDTTTTPWTKMMDIPMHDADGATSDGIIIKGATQDGSTWKTTPIEKITDIMLSKLEMVQPSYLNSAIAAGGQISQVQAIAQGNKLLIEVSLKTTNRANKTPVKMYDDQFLKIKLGVKAQAGLEVGDYIPKLK